MKVLIPIVSAGALLSLGACGQPASTATSTETTVTEDNANTMNDGAPALSAPSADEYLRTAALSDMYEIESSDLAVQRSQTPAVREFAQMMVRDHTATTAQVRSLAQAQNVALPTALDEARAGLISELREASAADFDERYIEQQIRAHTEAANLHRGMAQTAGPAPLQAFAAETAPKVEQHLMQLRAMENADDQAGAQQGAQGASKTPGSTKTN